MENMPYGKEPCLTCYAEDCLHRRKYGQKERTPEEHARMFAAPYICDVGGHSVCEGHWPFAMAAGWNPRLKTSLHTTCQADPLTDSAKEQ